MNFLSITECVSCAAGKLIATAAVLAVVGAAQAETGTPDAGTDAGTEMRNEAIVREAFETWRAGGSVFAALLAPDVKWTIHGSGPVAGTYLGLQDFVERASAPLVSRLSTPIEPHVHAIYADGDTIIVRFDGSATTTSGAPYRNQFVWIFRMKGGTVVEAEAFLDLVAYQQVVDNNKPRVQ